MNWIRYLKKQMAVQLEILFMLCGSLTEITPRKDFLKISKPTVSVLVGIYKLTVMLLHASGNGCHTNHWNLVTIRIGMFIYAQFIATIINFVIYVALAVFIRSPLAYEALKSFNILQLPSHATLQAYTGGFMHKASAASESISKKVDKYKIFQQSYETEKKLKPKSIGVLIFDEVKVVSSLMWNSRSHQIVGLAMTKEVQAFLHDVFQSFDKNHCTKQTSYILQFLWRDLTSSFDIVGPYDISEETMLAKVICPCIFETIKLFQVCKYT